MLLKKARLMSLKNLPPTKGIAVFPCLHFSSSDVRKAGLSGHYNSSRVSLYTNRQGVRREPNSGFLRSCQEVEIPDCKDLPRKSRIPTEENKGGKGQYR